MTPTGSSLNINLSPFIFCTTLVPLVIQTDCLSIVSVGAALASNFRACAALLVYFRVTAVLAKDLEDVWELPSW